jgi:hypothetical protein
MDVKQAVAPVEPDVRRLRLRAGSDTNEVIARSCDRKRPYGARCARIVAERRRSQGEQVSPYRCFYCGAWHVGHAPSLEGLRRIAEAIRDLHGNRPRTPAA